jgi:hypothetical protein
MKKNMKAISTEPLKVADEVWIATALLHKENPTRGDFTVAEIIERARAENITGEMRSGDTEFSTQQERTPVACSGKETILIRDAAPAK